MQRLSVLRLVWAAVGLALWTGALWAQCPMCKAAVVASEEGRQMAGGLNAGILYMLAAPYVIVGTIAFFAYRNWRRLG